MCYELRATKARGILAAHRPSYLYFTMYTHRTTPPPRGSAIVNQRRAVHVLKLAHVFLAGRPFLDAVLVEALFIFKSKHFLGYRGQQYVQGTEKHTTALRFCSTTGAEPSRCPRHKVVVISNIPSSFAVNETTALEPCLLL
jgi:hypothetical protein